VFGRGENPINFVSVQDVAKAVVHATTHPELRGRVIEVGGPGNLTLNELAGMLQRSMGWRGSLRHVPQAGLRTMGVLVRPVNPTMARLGRAALVMDTCDLTFDPEASNREYPWLTCTPIQTHGVLTQG